MAHTPSTEAALEVAREVRNLAHRVQSLVGVEERLLTRRDRAEDEGQTAAAERLQDQIDATVEEYRSLLDGRLLDLGVTHGISEDDDLHTCATVADWTVYAIVSTYPKVRA